MMQTLFRSRDRFAVVTFEMVEYLGGDLVAAAVFDWVAWKANAEYGGVPTDDGKVWFAQSRTLLAESMGISEKTARGALDRLVTGGHLEKRQLHLGGPFDLTIAYSPVWSAPLTLAPEGQSTGPNRGSTLAPEGQSSLYQDIQDLSLPAEGKDVVGPREDVEYLCDLLRSQIVANGSKTPTITKAWRDEARRLLDVDKRTLEEAEAVMRWSQSDDFWKSNILSMPKFRAKYDNLRLRMGSPSSRGGQNQQAAIDLIRQQQAREAQIAEIGEHQDSRSGERDR